MSVVTDNLRKVPGYTPYCGGENCPRMPRTIFNGRQFVCPYCGWVSTHEASLIEEYKALNGLSGGDTDRLEYEAIQYETIRLAKPFLRTSPNSSTFAAERSRGELSSRLTETLSSTSTRIRVVDDNTRINTKELLTVIDSYAQIAEGPPGRDVRVALGEDYFKPTSAVSTRGNKKQRRENRKLELSARKSRKSKL